MYIIARVHINSLGKMLTAETEEEAKDILRGEVEAETGQELTGEQIDSLNDFLEVVIDDETTWGIGTVG